MPERRKTFPVAMSDEQRAKYQEAADARGMSLAAWIRDACEVAVDAPPGREPVEVVRPTVAAAGGKRFTGPDPKVRDRPVTKERGKG